MAPRRAVDRIAAIAGIAMVATFVAIITTSTALPPPNRGMTAIEHVASGSRGAVLLTTYLGQLLSGTLLVFGLAVVARLRRFDTSGHGAWLIALGGIAATSVGLATDQSTVTFVRAVGHGLAGDALWAAYPSGPDGVVIAVPMAVFFLGVALSGFLDRAVGRGLSWSAVALCVAFVIGGASVTGDEVDGGLLGLFLLIGYFGLMIWTVTLSVQMWRAGRPAGTIAPRVVGSATT